MNRKRFTAMFGIPAAVAAMLLFSAGIAAAGSPTRTHHHHEHHHRHHHGAIGGGASTSQLGVLVKVAADSDHVATSPNGRYAYVASATQNLVTVVDLRTNKVVKTIGVGNAPVDVAFDASGAHAFVANTQDGTVSMIDTGSMAVTKTLKIATPDDWINDIAVNQTAAGVTIYVTAQHESYLRTMNVSTGKTGTIKTTQYPGSVVIAGGKLVVAQSYGPGNVDVIDLQTGTLEKQLTTPDDANVTAAAAVPGTTTVVLSGDSQTTWLDLATNTFVARLPAAAPGNLTGVTTSPKGTYSYIAAADFPDSQNPKNGTVTVVDNATHTVVKTVTVGQFPWSIAATGSVVVVPDAPTTGQNYLQIIPVTQLN